MCKWFPKSFRIIVFRTWFFEYTLDGFGLLFLRRPRVIQLQTHHHKQFPSNTLQLSTVWSATDQDQNRAQFRQTWLPLLDEANWNFDHKHDIHHSLLMLYYKIVFSNIDNRFKTFNRYNNQEPGYTTDIIPRRSQFVCSSWTFSTGRPKTPCTHPAQSVCERKTRISTAFTFVVKPQLTNFQHNQTSVLSQSVRTIQSTSNLILLPKPWISPVYQHKHLTFKNCNILQSTYNTDNYFHCFYSAFLTPFTYHNFE